MIINAEHEVIGRIATRAAKSALLGEKIDIVNCEKAVITGNKKSLILAYKKKLQRGDMLKGPHHERRPDKFVRKIIRGMLPYKQSKGKEAYKRIHCHIGIPDEFKEEKIKSIDIADVSKTHNLKYLTVGQICKQLGWKG